MEKVTLKVEGMSCGHCEAAVQDAVKKLPGIKKVKANRRKKEAAAGYDPALVTPEQIAAAINAAGYQATPPGEGDDDKQHPRDLWEKIINGINVFMNQQLRRKRNKNKTG